MGMLLTELRPEAFVECVDQERLAWHRPDNGTLLGPTNGTLLGHGICMMDVLIDIASINILSGFTSAPRDRALSYPCQLASLHQAHCRFMSPVGSVVSSEYAHRDSEKGFLLAMKPSEPIHKCNGSNARQREMDSVSSSILQTCAKEWQLY